MRDIKELLDKTTDLPEPLKEELVDTFKASVKQFVQEKLNIDVNKPLELLATDPDFKRLVIAWDRNNPETTRAQLLRSFPAAFKDLQGNTIAEPLVDFLMDILKALISDTSLMQRLIRQLDKNAREEGSSEETEGIQEGFNFIHILAENDEDYLEKEKFVLDSGYKFAFFANDELMPVEKDQATHKVFVKTVTVSNSTEPAEPAEPVEPEENEEASDTEEVTPKESSDSEFSFVAKKLVALEWKPEYGGVGAEEEEEEEEEEESESVEDKNLRLSDEEEVPEDESELVDKVNEYLEYVTEEFMKENKISIESGLKIELAENLINGMRRLLAENNIMEDKTQKNVVSSLEEKLKMNEDAMNSIYQKNIELFKENKQLKEKLFQQKVSSVMKEVFESENIPETTQERIKNLFKFVSLQGNEEDEEIKNKILEIKESIVISKPEKTNVKEKVRSLFETEKMRYVAPKNEPKKTPEEEITELLKNID